jgi:L-lactate dehydrogenase complex protein LldE
MMKLIALLSILNIVRDNSILLTFNNVKHTKNEKNHAKGELSMKEVSLFIPCIVDFWLPDIGLHAYHLLRQLGVAPKYHQEQTCCGQLAIHAGYLRQSKRAAKHFIEVFERDEEIVSLSGSCISTVKHRYPELFEDEPSWRDRALALAPRLFELTEYIVDVLGIEDVGAQFEGKVTYHESCRVLRGLGVSEQPKKLIRGTRGTEFVELKKADVCCGFGGEFSYTFPQISAEMVEEKCDHFIGSGADLLVLCEPGCLLNVSGYLNRINTEKSALHIASFLYRGCVGGLT